MGFLLYNPTTSTPSTPSAVYGPVFDVVEPLPTVIPPRPPSPAIVPAISITAGQPAPATGGLLALGVAGIALYLLTRKAAQ